MSTPKPPKPLTIGDLTGHWSILFRACLALGALLLPFGIGQMVWLVSNSFKQSAALEATAKTLARIESQYTTKAEQEAEHLRLKTAVIESVDSRFPAWLPKEVELHGKRLDALETRNNTPRIP